MRECVVRRVVPGMVCAYAEADGPWGSGGVGVARREWECVCVCVVGMGE